MTGCIPAAVVAQAGNPTVTGHVEVAKEWCTGVHDVIERAAALAATGEDEAAPYKHKYEAASALEAYEQRGQHALGALESCLGEAGSAVGPDVSSPSSTVIDSKSAARIATGEADAACSEDQTSPCPDAAVPSPTELSSLLKLLLAEMQLRRGIILLETDLLKDGENAVNSALPVLTSAHAQAQAAPLAATFSSPPPPPQQQELQQTKESLSEVDRLTGLLLEAYNALGALQCGRANFQAASEQLLAAQALYNRMRPSRSQLGPSLDSTALPAAADISQVASSASTSSSAGSPQPFQWDKVEALYTSTLFFLAQVHGHANEQAKSALYCAATLYRQLLSRQYSVDDWVQNCMQLGGYYAGTNAFAIAEHCIAAADAVAQGSELPDAGTQHASASETPQTEQQQQEEQASAAVPGSSESVPGKAAVTAATPPPAPTPMRVSEDVAANLRLARAKLFMMRLSTSYTAHEDGAVPDMPYPDISHFPDYLHFPGLGLPSPDTLPWGAAALAKDFPTARDIFNAAMPGFKFALEYYQLEGWVTEHVNILMEMSNLYRCLAGFETAASRRLAMQKQRAALISPLQGQLNPQYYLGLSRSVDLELAHVQREMLEIYEDEVSELHEQMKGKQSMLQKAQQGQLPPAEVSKAIASAEVLTKRSKASKVKASGCSSLAAQCYSRFIDSFKQDDGTFPERIDEGSEDHFIQACFSLGRVMHKVSSAPPAAAATAAGAGAGSREQAGTASCESVTKAVKQLEWARGYVSKHGLVQYSKEAELAGELSMLLLEKLKLQERLGAAR